MSTLVDRIEYKDYTVEVHQDEEPTNPREWDNLGTMVCEHRRYNLGDVQGNALETMVELLEPYCGDTFAWECWDCRWEDTEDHADAIVKAFDKHFLWLPLYLYDHGGISMSATMRYPFTDPWDAGQVGIIYIDKRKACEEYHYKIMTATLREGVFGYLYNEVQVYDWYLRGGVYGYEITDPQGEFVDSCWGYYGPDNEKSGLLEDVQGRVDYEIEHRRQTHADYLKGAIRGRVPLQYRQAFVGV